MKKILFKILLFSCTCLLNLSSCQKEKPEDTKKLSDKKAILSFDIKTFNEIKDVAMVRIIDSLHLVFINIGPAYDPKSLGCEIKVSDGARIKGHSNSGTVPNKIFLSINSPITQLAVEAENGTMQTYKIIITTVTGNCLTDIVYNNSVTSNLRVMGNIFNCTSAYNSAESLTNFTQGVSIILEDCNFKMSDLDEKNGKVKAVKLFLRNKNTSANLVGTYHIKAMQDDAICLFNFNFLSSAATFLFTPVSGTIEIINHDKTNNLISGKFTDITFKENRHTSHIINGQFTNVMIQ